MSPHNSVIARFYSQLEPVFDPQYMSNEVYEQVVRNTVVVCVDTVFVSLERRLFFLARRKARPMQNWWFIGGRVWVGETEHIAACRCIKRETGLVINPTNLTPVAMNRYLFNSRQQPPQNLGCDSLCYVFALETDLFEVAKASKQLDKDEYEEGGLKYFDRQSLVEAGVDQAVIDLYDLIFPAK